MRVAIIFILLCTICSSICGQGIQFDSTSNSWESILQKARKQGKPIFIDVYTKWCVPCKWMDINVFKNSEVGLFYNKKYLSIKIDAEKGFGISFAQENRINSYPTYLFFSPGGELLLAGIGAKPAISMLQIGEDAFNNWKNGVTLQDMKAKISAGNFEPAFLKSYIKKLSSLLSPNSLIIEEYLKLIPEDSLYTSNTLSLVSTGYFGRMPVNGIAIKVLLNAYKKYPIKSFELMSPWNTIRNRLLEYSDSAGRQHNFHWFNEIVATIHKIDTIQEIAEREKIFFLCRYLAAANDSINFKIQANEFALKYIQEVNIDSLYKSDILQFNKTLLIKFETDDELELKKNKDFEIFRKAYFSNTRMAVNEFLEIIYLSKTKFRKSYIFENETLKIMQLAAINMYKNNPIHVSGFILKMLQEN